MSAVIAVVVVIVVVVVASSENRATNSHSHFSNLHVKREKNIVACSWFPDQVVAVAVVAAIAVVVAVDDGRLVNFFLAYACVSFETKVRRFFFSSKTTFRIIWLIHFLFV